MQEGSSVIADDDPAVAPLVDLARPSTTDVCLDYGTGVGRAAFALAPLVRRVEAVDDDPDVLREAERLGAELGLSAIAYQRADLRHLPYAGPVFDLVLCRMVLHRLLEPVAALREMSRVLLPGGRVIVYDAVVDEATDRYFNELARLRQPSHWRHYRLEEYAAMFREAGLRESGRAQVRRSVDLDAWAEAGLSPSGDLQLVSERLRSYPVPVQLAMDVAYSDRRAAFSYDVLVVRLEV
jgi:SAM-dependent methyltransferase